MMRMTQTTPNNTLISYRVEGDITNAVVAELEQACAASLAEGRSLVLDLTAVRFVDEAGVHTLNELQRHGAVLVGCSGFLTEMLRTEEQRETTELSEEREREEQLVAALRRGEDAAFETLVRRYSGRMLAAARRLLNNEHDAQDAVQEAYMSAFKAIGTFAGNAKLSTWLHRIVVNAALMKLRSRRRKPEASLDDLLPHFDEEGKWTSPVTDWRMSTDTLLQRQETREQVRQCIDQLPATYRTILMLRDIEELDTDETAAAMKITANAVKIRLHRARQALRTLLEQKVTAHKHESRVVIPASGQKQCSSSASGTTVARSATSSW